MLRSTSKRGAPRTNDHSGELETLPHGFAMDLVGEICEADVTHEFLSDYGRNAGSGGLGERAVGPVGGHAVGGGRHVAVARAVVVVGHGGGKNEGR